jgi:hypothetical protein
VPAGPCAAHALRVRVAPWWLRYLRGSLRARGARSDGPQPDSEMNARRPDSRSGGFRDSNIKPWHKLVRVRDVGSVATDSVVVSRRPRDAEAAWRAGTGWRRDRLSRQDGCCWAAPCVPARAPCQSRAAGGAEPGGGGGDGEGLQEGGTGVTGDQAPRGVPMPP